MQYTLLGEAIEHIVREHEGDHEAIWLDVLNVIHALVPYDVTRIKKGCTAYHFDSETDTFKKGMAPRARGEWRNSYLATENHAAMCVTQARGYEYESGQVPRKFISEAYIAAEQVPLEEWRTMAFYGLFSKMHQDHLRRPWFWNDADMQLERFNNVTQVIHDHGPEKVKEAMEYYLSGKGWWDSCSFGNFFNPSFFSNHILAAVDTGRKNAPGAEVKKADGTWSNTPKKAIDTVRYDA